MTPTTEPNLEEVLQASRAARKRGRGFIVAAVIMALPLLPVELSSLGWHRGSRFDFDIRYDWSLLSFLAGLVLAAVGITILVQSDTRTTRAMQQLVARGASPADLLEALKRR